MIHQTGGECKFFVAAGPLFRQNFFPEGSIKKARGEIFPSAHRIGASAAAAVVAAAVVAVAAPAEQDDNQNDNPQPAVAAPTVVSTEHNISPHLICRDTVPAFCTILWRLLVPGDRGAGKIC